MRASAVEFRLRMVIQIAIVVFGFWAPWIHALDLGKRVSALEWLTLEISRAGVLPFTYATPVVIAAGALVAAMGMVLRVWGAAYLGYSTVHHGQMQAGGVMASGPYRYVRNPLYLGGWFMMVAISLIMTPSGALFTLLLVGIFYLRLILGEEAFLADKLGAPYREYLRTVPRLIPGLRSSLPAGCGKPHWLVAVLTEINPIGIFFTIAILSWTYDNELMMKSIVVSFGVSLIVRALMPRGQIRTDSV